MLGAMFYLKRLYTNLYPRISNEILLALVWETFVNKKEDDMWQFESIIDFGINTHVVTVALEEASTFISYLIE